MDLSQKKNIIKTLIFTNLLFNFVINFIKFSLYINITKSKSIAPKD